jgi:hypothetical protein
LDNPLAAEGDPVTTIKQLRNTLADPDSRCTRTVLFIDVAGSTAMKERQPEPVWLEHLGWLYDTVTAIAVDAVPDVTIKYLGDGVMLVCDTDHTTDAVNAVVQMQEKIRIAGVGVHLGTIDPTYSVGVSTGEVIRFATAGGALDYVGTIVDTALALGALAGGRGILVDATTVNAANLNRLVCAAGRAADGTALLGSGEPRRAVLPGVGQPVAYHEILWDRRGQGATPRLTPGCTASAEEPADGPEAVGRLFREVFDLVDEDVDEITDADVEDRLRRLLAEAGYADPAQDSHREPGEVAHAELARLTERLCGSTDWDRAGGLARAAQDEAAFAWASAGAARREAEIQMEKAERAARTAAAARRHAAEIFASAEAYIDTALDRGHTILAEARDEAARIVADAHRHAGEIAATAQARAASSAAGQMPAAPSSRCWKDLVDLVGAGAHGTFVASLVRHLDALSAEIQPAMVIPAAGYLRDVLRTVADALPTFGAFPTGSIRRTTRVSFDGGQRIDVVPAARFDGRAASCDLGVVILNDAWRSNAAKLLRRVGDARQVVLVGDDRQLPPYSAQGCLECWQAGRTGCAQCCAPPIVGDVVFTGSRRMWSTAHHGDAWRKILISVKRFGAGGPDTTLAVVPSVAIEMLVTSLLSDWQTPLIDPACGTGGFLLSLGAAVSGAGGPGIVIPAEHAAPEALSGCGQMA